ncbi:MAG: TldD/PmbA family protein [Bacillota bacterium]|nr:TldD/PmbA family protein [Bacillota bacterium]
MRPALDAAVRAGAEYADIRRVGRVTESIGVRQGAVRSISSSSEQGFGVRVLAGGAWGFAASSRLDPDEVQRVARQAVGIARASAQVMDRKVTLAPVEPVTDTYRTPVRVDPFAVKMEDKVSMLLEADRLVSAQRKPWRVATRLIGEAYLNWSRENKRFLSTEGADIQQELVECGGGVAATAGTLREIQRRSYPNAHRGHYATAGWEFVESLRLADAAPRIGREALALLGARRCPSGRTALILDSTQMALQIHESCGHPIELDRVFGSEASFAGTSFLTPDKRGAFRYGSEAVNITADATMPGGLGTFGYDDEGVPAQRTEIIREGVFLNYLTSRDTAPLVGDEASSGAARATGPDRIPIVRMTNVNLEPGDWTLDAMIRDTQDGILMETNLSWSIDDRRLNFQFAAEAGWEIKDGSLGAMLKNPNYTGITPEFWGACDAVGDKSEWRLWGTPNCGKGQPSQVAHVGHGASPARFRDVRVGVGR